MQRLLALCLLVATAHADVATPSVSAPNTCDGDFGFAPLADVDQPEDVVADGEYLYVHSRGDEVTRLSRAHPSDVVVLAPRQGKRDPEWPQLEADESTLYWVDSQDRLLAVAKTGGAVRQLAALEPAASHAIAVGRDAVYVAAQERLLRVSKGGREVHPVYTGEESIDDVAVDDDTIYFIYWSGSSPRYRQIRAISKSGGPARVLAREQREPFDLIAHGDHVYWLTDRMAPSVSRVAKRGGAVEAIKQVAEPVALAARGQYVYWLEAHGREHQGHRFLDLARAWVGDLRPERLGAFRGEESRLAVDDVGPVVAVQHYSVEDPSRYESGQLLRYDASVRCKPGP
jgi:hypothetical protein